LQFERPMNHLVYEQFVPTQHLTSGCNFNLTPILLIIRQVHFSFTFFRHNNLGKHLKIVLALFYEGLGLEQIQNGIHELLNLAI